MTTIFTSASPRLLRSIGLATAITLAATFSLAQSVPPPSPDGPDPALVNLAPSDQAVQTQQAAPDPSANPQDYLQQVPAPIVRSAPTPTANPGFPNSADSYNAPDSAAGDPSSDQRQHCRRRSRARRRRHRRRPASTTPPRLRPTPRARRRLPLDTRLLGLRSRWLLLGSRRLDRTSLLRRSLDAWLLGLVGQSLSLAPRLLGHPRRLLWRRQLRLWIHRRRLLRWLLERRPLLLQPLRHQRRPLCHQRLHPHRRLQQPHLRRTPHQQRQL